MKLSLVFEQLQRSEARRGQRQLMIAAAGSAGGDAAKTVWKFLDRQARGDEPPEREGEPVSQTPTSQEEFERMLKENGS